MSGCRSCRADMEFVRTTAGRLLPLDLEPTPEGNVRVVDGAAHVAKVAEEAGEAVDALIGVTGQNPRKGHYGSRLTEREETGLLWCRTHRRMVPPTLHHKCHADDPAPCDVAPLVPFEDRLKENLMTAIEQTAAAEVVVNADDLRTALGHVRRFNVEFEAGQGLHDALARLHAALESGTGTESGDV